MNKQKSKTELQLEIFEAGYAVGLETYTLSPEDQACPYLTKSKKADIWNSGYRKGRDYSYAEDAYKQLSIELENERKIARNVKFIVQRLIDRKVKTIDINAHNPQFHDSYSFRTEDLLELRRKASEII